MPLHQTHKRQRTLICSRFVYLCVIIFNMRYPNPRQLQDFIQYMRTHAIPNVRDVLDRLPLSVRANTYTVPFLIHGILSGNNNIIQYVQQMSSDDPRWYTPLTEALLPPSSDAPNVSRGTTLAEVAAIYNALPPDFSGFDFKKDKDSAELALFMLDMGKVPDPNSPSADYFWRTVITDRQTGQPEYLCVFAAKHNHYMKYAIPERLYGMRSYVDLSEKKAILKLHIENIKKEARRMGKNPWPLIALEMPLLLAVYGMAKQKQSKQQFTVAHYLAAHEYDKNSPNDAEVLERLNKMPILSLRAKDGVTVGMTAAYHNNLLPKTNDEMQQILGQRTRQGWTTMHFLALHNAKQLFSDIAVARRFLNVANAHGVTPFHVAASSFAAAAVAQDIKNLARQDPDLALLILQKTDKLGRTVAHMLANAGDLVPDLLIELAYSNSERVGRLLMSKHKRGQALIETLASKGKLKDALLNCIPERLRKSEYVQTLHESSRHIQNNQTLNAATQTPPLKPEPLNPDAVAAIEAMLQLSPTTSSPHQRSMTP